MSRKHPPANYPAGYFTALIREHNWPPNFTPKFPQVNDDFRRMLAASQARDRSGNPGTVLMPNTPTWRRPEMMKAGA